MSSWLATMLVATGFLLVAWVRWPRERGGLSAQRWLLGTIGLSGTSAATLGSGFLLLDSHKVEAYLGAFWSIRDVDALLVKICVISLGFSCSCRGTSRIMGVGSALLMAVSLAVKVYDY